MGLAASQARFLGITARKNSCELRSMQIAQEKLSITNQLTQISEDYQRSLSATKLVWDSEFITDGSVYDVTYDLLMQPSLLNGYSPQLLTNNRNQIVLDSQYANAISMMENTVYEQKDTNGTVISNLKLKDMQLGGAQRTEANFKGFLKALNQGGILSELNYNNMINALNKTVNPNTGVSSFYRPDNGLGGDIQEKFTASSMNLSTLKSYINNVTDPSSKYMNDLRETYGTSSTPDDASTLTAYDKAVKIADLLNFTMSKSYEVKRRGTVETAKDSSGQPIMANSFGEYCEKDYALDISDSKFNFADLLNKEITLSSDNSTKMGDALSEFIGSMYNIMSEFFAIDPSSVDQDYLNFAFSQICSLNGLTWDSTSHQAGNFKPEAALSTGDSPSKHTGLTKNGNDYQISLSNVAKGLLTFFEKAVEGFDSGYNVQVTGDKKVEDSFYVTNDPAYYYFINPVESNDIDDETQNLLDYYSQMFNQICANGWTENSLVSEPESLKNMLKNGTLFTSVLSDDGNFYQAPYTRNNYVAEVADQDAITRAEAEYKTKQLKLSAKEEELNIDMQMVDAELSALTTEFDTVKQMISKGVEKGFSTLGG